MVVSVPLSYDFGCYFLHLIHRYCQTILTFQHVISSLRVYALQFWPRCEAVMWRIQTAWLSDCPGNRRHSSCLATALKSVPVNDRVWRSIVLWLKCVLQYFCSIWSWSWIWAKSFQCFCWVWLEPMTWKNLRPKILARYDFSGYAGEASWDSFKSFIIPECPTGLAF